MRSASDALIAIRARLVAAGHDVYLGKIVDLAQDVLPIVTVHYSGDGERTVSERPERQAELDIVVEYHARTRTDDPLIELIPVSDSIRALLTAHDDDRLDRLGGVVDSCTHQRTIIQTHLDHTDVGVVHAAFRVTF